MYNILNMLHNSLFTVLNNFGLSFLINLLSISINNSILFNNIDFLLSFFKVFFTAEHGAFIITL